MNKLPPLPDPIRLARRPTPIEVLPRLSEQLGVRVLVKRDDLTGMPLSGNKVRKLEYALAEGVRHGATAVVTTGGVQSNHCRATAVAARRLGLEPYLLLRTSDGLPPAEADGNYFLNRLLGARIRHITPSEYADRNALLADWSEELARTGIRAIVVPEGASDAIGALGYVAAAEELAGQLERGEVDTARGAYAVDATGPVRIDAIVHACGSGGTAAGLAAGMRALGLETPVLAYAVCDDRATFRARIDEILADLQARFALPGPADVFYDVVDDYKGVGYAVSTSEELTFLRNMARLEGMILDPVYTGKAFRGLVEDIRAGRRLEPGATVLFVHTGGLFGLFPKRDEIPL